MPAPTLDRDPRTSTQAGTTAGRRRNRKQLVLVASALVVLAVAVGTSLAIATRPHAPPAGQARAPSRNRHAARAVGERVGGAARRRRHEPGHRHPPARAPGPR